MEEEALLFWVMYLVKYVELLDTVIFVFRKKYQQISFLHVFHHAVVVSIFFTAVHHDYHIGKTINVSSIKKIFRILMTYAKM
ncbi:UNVERIFIED_CONTAM: Elovl2 [Trichonephila clavipes]